MDTSSLAKRVVTESLQVTKSDSVLVYCSKQTVDLAETIALECQKAGAHTSLALLTDRLQYDVLLERPIEFLEMPDPFQLASLDTATLLVDVSAVEDPASFQRMTPERWTAISKGNEPYNEKVLKSKAQGAAIGLGYLTLQRAKVYGFDYTAWKENSYAAIDVSYEEMRRTGAKVRRALEAAKEIRITNAAGADLSVRTEGAQIRVDDGVVNRRNHEKTTRSVELPGGSVTMVPDVSSAKGTFVSDVALPNSGKLVRGISWKFEKGLAVSFEGKENIELVKNQWTGATGDKSRFGLIQFGINPNAKPGYLFSHMVRGAVTVGIGDNRWYGGKNDSSTYVAGTSVSATVKLDNKAVIDKGKLVL